MSATRILRGGAALAVALCLTIGAGTGCGNSSAVGSHGATAPATATNAAATPEPEPEPEEDAIAVEVGPVTRDSVSALYATSATLRADKRATVTSRTAGVVKQLLVEEGDWVEGGQILAILEDDEQTIEHEKASFVAKTKGREFERAKTLHDQGLLSEEEFEVKRREAEEARQSAVMTELILERTRVRASFTGRITLRHLDVGNTVTNGTAFYDIADLDPLYADVSVPERHIARLAAGQAVRLVADAGSGLTRASIERLAPVVDPETGTVKVTLAVSGGANLRPGSFVRVEIVTDTHADTLVVPRSALVAEGRRWHVFRMTADGKTVERLEVDRGFEEDDRVEVAIVAGSDAPLAAGDSIVVVGASALADGSVVRTLSSDGLSQATDSTNPERERDAT